MTILIKVNFKAWEEHARHDTFTAFSYRQIQANVGYLRYMLPHYVCADSSISSSIESLGNLLDELTINVCERCMDVECVAMTEYYDEVKRQVMPPSNIIMGYLVEESGISGRSSVLEQFLIREEKDGGN